MSQKRLLPILPTPKRSRFCKSQENPSNSLSNGGSICNRNTSGFSQKNIAKSPSSSLTTPQRSKPSTCAITTTARPLLRWMFSFQKLAKSSAEASAKSASSASRKKSSTLVLSLKTTGGISSSENTAPFPMPALAQDLSALCNSQQELKTSATPSLSLASRAMPISRLF